MARFSLAAFAVRSASGDRSMPADKHYFIEQTSDGRLQYAPKDIFETEGDAIAHVKMVNPDDHPDIRIIRGVATDGHG
jgi:hypothetical protein